MPHFSHLHLRFRRVACSMTSDAIVSASLKVNCFPLSMNGLRAVFWVIMTASSADLTRSGQRRGRHSLPTIPCKTSTRMDHSHHHMHTDHSATPDTSTAIMDRCIMYMLWFVTPSCRTPNFSITIWIEVRAGTRISSIHVSSSVNGTSTPTSSSSLAASQSS